MSMDVGAKRVGGVLLWVSMVLLAGRAAAAEVPEVSDSAYAEGAVEEEDPRVEARLLVNPPAVGPEGRLRVGVLFDIDPDWHIYWRNSGDSGMATRVDWSGEAVEYEPLQWPAPHVFQQDGGEITTFGYGDRVLLFSEATVTDRSGGRATVEATVDYLVCKVDCIPGSADLSRDVELVEATGDESDASDVADIFDRWAERVPRDPESLGIAVDTAFSRVPIRPGDTVEAAVGLNFCPEGRNSCKSWEVVEQKEGWAFVPGSAAPVEWTTVGMAEHPAAKRGRVLRLKGRASPNAPEDGERLTGVVHLEGADGQRTSVRVDAPLPRGPEGADTEQSDDPLLDVEVADAQTGGAASGDDGGGRTVGFWQALLFAFFGGMILNLMPCVFPVLALKVSAFARLVHEDRRSILAHGGAYTAGIVGSMLVLAGVVLGLRAVGTQVGWGFQFQNPLFPAVLAGVLVAFAMNLFGVFEVNVQAAEIEETAQEASGVQRSFWEGILAVVLATPCSAPFLGSAVGFALAGSAGTVVTIFAALGAGLAAPFVVLTLVPGWAEVLPSPGPWMVHLKRVLGFTLIGAAVWLASIVGSMSGVDGMIRLLIFLVAVSFGVWMFGRGQQGGRWARRGTAALMVAVIAATGVWTLHFWPTDSELQWREWSEPAVERHLEQGQTVFVDFTAEWCATCKYNERQVLASEAVVDAFARENVATLKGDWTQGGEAIRKKLAEFGKAGVPLYLVYRPDAPDDPVVLPEMLTSSMVLDAIGGGGADR